MCRLLIIIDRYLPIPSSNGVCISNIVSKMMETGWKVSVLCIFGKYDPIGKFGENVYSLNLDYLKIPFYNKLFGYAQDEKTVNNLYKVSDEIVKKHHIEIIISAYRPIETVLCGERLRKYLFLRHIPCFFDISETPGLGYWKNSIINYNFFRLIKYLVKKNNIYVLKYYKQKFQLELGEKSKANIVSFGVPNLVRQNDDIEYRRDKIKKINMVYAGSFYESIRNPNLVLEYLSFVKNTNIYIHLFSWGCESIVEKYMKIFGENLINHGRKTSEEIKKRIIESDILINISNDTNIQVPGKIIEYFSTGKPILNFKYRNNDPGDVDYSRYPLIKNILLNTNYQIHDCKKWIYSVVGKKCSFEDISSIFSEELPDAFIRTIRIGHF